ncbi:MAG: RNA polymerase sigma-70 factor [Candidatus Aminicenantes bacterium]|nr:RNA polymerase sigma-70 factor [Candidatus Aminicenantes bacterium]NIM81194.1 RNA polymerase sigma-70 factor [Candidatus Aminicenantes bacterium]NIN20569.1 RNA polymerase sigma-70 factor [Candidatus Aminicenantes bacterium]NIN44348.1 RNA polymerase sigma-70 factor [Candidatus Aminicenantes bacterium]NIN87167.1 RNA polymerase sigma-70 factor [Candidatus Aminicenantes bacterium]
MKAVKDNYLVQLIAENDDTAFEEIVHRYHVKVINLVYYFLHDRNEAEDIAQDVFLKVWRNAGKFKGKSSFATWLYRIVVNTCLNHRRDKKNEAKYLESNIDPADITGNPDCIPGSNRETLSMLTKEEREYWVHRAIQKLPPMQRMAIILSRFEGYSYKEIAKLMNVSVSSVESHLFRAKKNVARFLLPLKKKGEI